MSNPEYRFPHCVSKLASNVVTASLTLHQKVALFYFAQKNSILKLIHVQISLMFLPTAVKFHYIFNLRDLTNVFQGLLFSNTECLTVPSDLVRLWMHETQRVYGDKLADEKDIELFFKIQADIVKKNFEVSNRI